MMEHKFKHIYPMKEITELEISRPRHKWGSWMFNRQNLTLQHFMEGHIGNEGFIDYEVDLEECIHAPSILDWILQIANKTWITADDIGNLVLALNQLAKYGLQGMVCPGGMWGRYTSSKNRVDYKALLSGGRKGFGGNGSFETQADISS